MIVRNYEKKTDLALYLEGERESFGATYPGLAITTDIEEYFRFSVQNGFASGESQGFTLEDDGVAVGAIIVSLNSFYSMPMGYIDNVYIREDYRGKQGLALLFSAAESFVVQRGLGFVQLDVSVLNSQAVRAYEKMGYVIVRHSMEKKLS